MHKFRQDMNACSLAHQLGVNFVLRTSKLGGCPMNQVLNENQLVPLLIVRFYPESVWNGAYIRMLN
jgi:hypothetical protein